jgi:hypothetical protein
MMLSGETKEEKKKNKKQLEYKTNRERGIHTKTNAHGPPHLYIHLNQVVVGALP